MISQDFTKCVKTVIQPCQKSIPETFPRGSTAALGGERHWGNCSWQAEINVPPLTGPGVGLITGLAFQPRVSMWDSTWDSMWDSACSDKASQMHITPWRRRQIPITALGKLQQGLMQRFLHDGQQLA